MGFSQRVCLPALSAAMVMGAWKALGVQTLTASTPLRSRTSSYLGSALAPYFFASFSARSGTRSTKATISTSGWAAYSGACRCVAMLPLPMTATPIFFFAMRMFLTCWIGWAGVGRDMQGAAPRSSAYPQRAHPQSDSSTGASPLPPHSLGRTKKEVLPGQALWEVPLSSVPAFAFGGSYCRAFTMSWHAAAQTLQDLTQSCMGFISGYLAQAAPQDSHALAHIAQMATVIGPCRLQILAAAAQMSAQSAESFCVVSWPLVPALIIASQCLVQAWHVAMQSLQAFAQIGRA